MATDSRGCKGQESGTNKRPDHVNAIGEVYEKPKSFLNVAIALKETPKTTRQEIRRNCVGVTQELLICGIYGDTDPIMREEHHLPRVGTHKAVDKETTI